jgi:hypothetical protein
MRRNWKAPFSYGPSILYAFAALCFDVQSVFAVEEERSCT